MQKQLIFATIFLSIFGNFKAQMAVTEIEALKNDVQYIRGVLK